MSINLVRFTRKYILIPRIFVDTGVDPSIDRFSIVQQVYRVVAQRKGKSRETMAEVEDKQFPLGIATLYDAAITPRD